MTTPGDSSHVPSKLAQPGATAAPPADDPRERRRRELRSAECARRGVRFLPAQAMRALYEKEGLL